MGEETKERPEASEPTTDDEADTGGHSLGTGEFHRFLAQERLRVTEQRPRQQQALRRFERGDPGRSKSR